jgi:queuosine precursor transporter
MILVPLYLAAIVAANLITTHYGPEASVYTSFAFIGLILTTRDRLHDLWPTNRVPKMAALIVAGAVLSYLLNQDAVKIAQASCIAFAAAESVDFLTYSALIRWEWLQRSNISNFLSAAVDSLVFPTIAFGGVMWGITFGQFTAKVGGGLLFSLILAHHRRREVATA